MNYDYKLEVGNLIVARIKGNVITTKVVEITEDKIIVEDQHGQKFRVRPRKIIRVIQPVRTQPTPEKLEEIDADTIEQTEE